MDSLILNDYVFKQVFGKQENERILISFLNAMLDGNYNIKSAKVINSEMPRFSEFGRAILLDVQVQTDNGTYIDIEVQRGYRPDLVSRMFVYGAGMINEHLEKASAFNSIKCIAIWILDCKIPEFARFENDPIIGQFCFRSTNNENKYLALKELEVYPIELKKGINIKNMSSYKQTWINFLKNSTDISKPEEMEEIHDAFYRMRKVTGDDKYRAYRRALDKAEQLRLIETFQARKEGRAKGLEEGLEQGRAKGLEEGITKGLEQGLEQGIAKGKAEGERNAKLETAKNLLNMGMTVEQVSTATGLSTQEIKEI